MQRLVTCSWWELELKTGSQLMHVLCINLEVFLSSTSISKCVSFSFSRQYLVLSKNKVHQKIPQSFFLNFSCVVSQKELYDFVIERKIWKKNSLPES